MAERNFDKYVPFVSSQNRPSSTSKVKMPKRTEVKPRAKSACGPLRKPANDFFAKEEEYKLLNAKLEAKTAELVRQAEQLVKQQNEALSKPLSTCLLSDLEDKEAARRVSSQIIVEEPQETVKTKRQVMLKGKSTGNQRQEPEADGLNPEGDLLDDDSVDAFLANTIRCIEEKMNDTLVLDDVQSAGDNDGISTAQVRVLKAKIQLMQQEQDQLSCEYHKKDDENAKLSAKIKEIEEDRARQQKTVNIQQTQIEKHKALGEESVRKCNSLQMQVSALQKEIENLNRSQKQATAVHGTVEVRLTRALEEVEKLKTQIKKMKQMNQDKINEEHQSKENLLAENRMLKKQKAELIEGFKKQLKLIDILKRQKMHFEAAKLLSFTEEEFMKALDWGKP